MSGMKVSPFFSFLSVSAACHIGLFLGFGTDDVSVYHISMEESVSAVAVNIVAVKPELPKPKKAKPKPPVKEEPLLTTEEKTEQLVEEIPPVEDIREIDLEPAPLIEPVEETIEEENKEEELEEVNTVEVDEVPETSDVQQKESTNSVKTREMSGAFTKSYPIANQCPAPRYPQQAREKGIEGKVILKVTVDELGKVKRVWLERSSGSKILDRRAVITVRKRWHFEPARRGENAVESIINVELLFRLNK
jgi:protein TonB